MIKNELVVKRYSEAFLMLAKNSIGLEKAVEELVSLSNDVFRKNPRLLTLLSGYEATSAEKNSIIDNTLASYSQDIRDLIKLLVEKRRMDTISDICEYVRGKYSHGKDVEPAVLKTSFPLDISVIKDIQKRVEKKYKKKFKFYIHLDSNLLGGIQIAMSNKVLDGSVRTRLDHIRRLLMTVRV